jgi:diguanylate cyclase (GGDEF)-like protein
MRVAASKRVLLLLMVPVILTAGAVFATAQVERHAALLGARRATASEQMLTSMLNQETGSRGFFETRDAVFLEPWTAGTKNFGSSLAALRSLIAGDSALTAMLNDQARRASTWHATTAVAIATLRAGGRPETVAAALRGKSIMDGFRAAHATFDAQLTSQSRSSLARATVISVAVAAVLAILLAWLGLALTRRLTRREQLRLRDQSELRELLQVSETEEESRRLLIRHIEKIMPEARAIVLNRNNSDDRLEVTHNEAGDAIPDDSLLSPANADQLRRRSCMAVRLSRTYEHQSGEGLLVRCEICGDMRASSVCEPLLVGGKVIGSVLVVSDSPIEGERRARMRESVAQATPILDNQRNLMLAETRAASDALTGLPNRRAANETLKRMAMQAGRSNTLLAAIVLELDRFKTVNDRYGHESGDKALALVGRIISSTIRDSDFAARFGGEEFLILLPDTHHEGAIVVAEKLRTEIASAEVTGIGRITASLGVAVLPLDAVESDELLRKADRALYTAKEAGRNRVHAFASRTAETQDPPSNGHGSEVQSRMPVARNQSSFDVIV